MNDDASPTDPGHARTPERWARFRFSVVGQLLAAPPSDGKLRHRLQELASQSWRHPVSGEPVTFGASTIERWYYAARHAQDPVRALARRLRSDHGQHPAISSQAAEWLTTQYRDHPSWSYQLHADNLAVRLEADPTLGTVPSYASVKRFLQAHGMFKRPRRGPAHSPGARQAEHRYEARDTRRARCAVTRASMSTPSGTWTSTTVRCACSSPMGGGRIRFYWPSSTIIRAWAAMPSGTSPRAPRNCATA